MSKTKILNDVGRLVGKKIRRIRGRIGQKEFARLINSNKDQVSRYEKGHNIPRDKTLKKIAEYGKTSIDVAFNLRTLVMEDEPIYETTGADLKKSLDNVKEILENIDSRVIDVIGANTKDSLTAVRSKNKDNNKQKE